MRRFAWLPVLVLLVGIAGFVAADTDTDADIAEVSIPSIDVVLARFDEMCPLRFCESDDTQTALYERSETFPYDARVEYVNYDKVIGIELYRDGALSGVYRLHEGVWSSQVVGDGKMSSKGSGASPPQFSCAPNS